MIHSERSLLFEAVNGKQLQFFGTRLDQILVSKYTPVREITILYVTIPTWGKDPEPPPLPKEPDPSDLKLEETFSL